MQSPTIAFFGGEPLGVPVLQQLYDAGIVPNLIVCSPDRPAGRGQQLTPPPVKVWAITHGIEVFQPESYQEKLPRLTNGSWDLFVVVAYNFILPNWLLELPSRGCINVHPSLLPKLRGPSPIRTAILENLPDQVGVSIMLLDEKMDHGPLLSQTSHTPDEWPIPGPLLDVQLADKGGALLAKTIRAWLENTIVPIEQDHRAATYTKKFQKPDNEIVLDPFNLPKGDEAVKLLHKIYAWSGIGDTYFIHDGERVKIKAAERSSHGQLIISSVVPAGKKEMPFATYLQSLGT